MINTMQLAIIKKDLRSLVYNKRLFPVLLIVPLVLTVVVPTIFILGIHFAPDNLGDLQQLLNLLPIGDLGDNMPSVLTGLIFNHVMPVFFMIIPIMAATIMAASSFVGEKERRTLETLLYCPLTLQKIFQSKIFASFILSMFVSIGSFLVMIVLIEAEIFLLSGNFLLPSINWLITLLVVSPAISFMSITLIVRGSAKAQTMEESQQRAIFLILPILLLIVGQFTGILLINSWLLLGLGLLFALIAGILMKGSIRNFTYEVLLKQ